MKSICIQWIPNRELGTRKQSRLTIGRSLVDIINSQMIREKQAMEFAFFENLREVDPVIEIRKVACLIAGVLP